MIRLPVLDNLPPGTDEEAFLHWRLTEHQASNASMPGVLRTDFGRIDGSWPPDTKPPHRFMTIAEWPDRAAFERAFHADDAQTDLRANLDKLADPIFLISDILTETTPGGT